ncbi:hypothetical protein FA95DRAFT_1676317 [Auriscalpium vulgare]|uniref:Uncharacterized protein n=1 Tax=Auriscalpium vulgare TaxID=40419 RepID=A0ACB8S4M2_9AGAM|nr:hypothetical protein FA95DRAFT_1676317 [Auriscalpium vulgare]
MGVDVVACFTAILTAGFADTRHSFVDPQQAEELEQGRARLAHAQYNALQPICLLPPEILWTIFAFLIPHDPPLHRKQTWIKVTFVCTHFRRVALAEPALWARMAFPLVPALRDTMLDRARAALLHINALWPMCAGEAPFITENIARTASLRLDASTPPNSTLLTTLRGRSAPVLELLEVTIRGRPDYGEALGFGGSLGFGGAGGHALPLGFLKDEAPSLRHLRLHTPSRWVWKCVFLRHLHTLDVTYSAYIPEIPPPDEVLDALESIARSLTTLKLDIAEPQRAADRNAYTNARTFRMVELPMLEYMCIRTRLMRGAALLEHLALPISTTLRIELVYHGEVTPAQFGTTLPTFLQGPRIRGASPPPATRLSIAPPAWEERKYADDVAVKAWSSAISAQPNFALFLQRAGPRAAVPLLAPAAFAAFASPSLERLVLAELREDRDLAWFTRAPSQTAGLRELEVHGSVASILDQILGQESTALSGDGAVLELLPMLAKLRIYGATGTALTGCRAWGAARVEVGRPVALQSGDYTLPL